MGFVGLRVVVYRVFKVNLENGSNSRAHTKGSDDDVYRCAHTITVGTMVQIATPAPPDAHTHFGFPFGDTWCVVVAVLRFAVLATAILIWYVPAALADPLVPIRPRIVDVSAIG